MSSGTTATTATEHDGLQKQHKNALSSAEVISILSICRDASVAVLKFRDLYVSFDKPTKLEPAPQVVSNIDLTHSSTVAKAIANIQTQQSKESLEQDEITLKQEQLAQLFIENPKLAEELLLTGKLDEDDSNGGLDGE